MRIGSLFSGIGGMELGLEAARLGHTVWQVERNPFCRQILRQHWPEVTRFEDVRTVGAHNLAPVDLICGGFPCQDVSGAGKGRGLAGERSGLWYQYARILGELKPEWAVVENVASGASRWVDAVMRGLEQLGYETLPLPIEAADVGAPHRRARVFLVARRVPHTHGEPLRHGAERGPEGRQGGLRDPGQPEPRNLGTNLAHPHGLDAQGGSAPGAAAGRPAAAGGGRHTPNSSGEGGVADPRGRGRQGGGLAQHGDEQSQAGADSHGRSGNGVFKWPPGPLDDWGDWFGTIGVTPGVERPVRGGPDGVSYRVERRLRKEAITALGNAVVPQCAQVVGEVIQLLRNQGARP